MTYFRCFLIVIVLLALSGSPAHASFEPVTCKNSFTVPQEIAEGNKVAAQVYQQMPVLPENDPITRYVQQLGAKLVANAPPTPRINERWPYNFHVVASEDINAFALPGGSVFVNLGTIQAAETEAQLAGVMAHEISHVVMRHSTCNLSKQRSKSLLYGIGAIGSAVLLGNGGLGQLAQTGLGLGQSLDFLHMSRDDEKQADLLGTNILYNAGYDPRGLPQFFEAIQAKYGKGGAQLLSDHPNPGNRTEYVNAEIQTLPPRSGSVVTTAQFKQIHTAALAQHTLTAKDIQAGSWKGSGRYASGPGSNGAALPVSGNASVPPPQASSPVALNRASLGLDDPLQTLQADLFTLRFPSNWQRRVNAGTVTIFPQGGAGDQGIVYGALIDTARDVGVVSNPASLSRATSELIQKLLRENDGLVQSTDITEFTAEGGIANAVEFTGRSPLTQNGTPLSERDWLVTIARPDRSVSYLVFVAPNRDFAMLKPAFSRILASFRPH